jgi:hypothetical protein
MLPGKKAAAASAKATAPKNIVLKKEYLSINDKSTENQIVRITARGAHINFSSDIKRRWIVKRDQCRDEYIALTGKNVLGYGGLDHIYLISPIKVGLWLTSRQIRQKIKSLKRKIPKLSIEQLGEDEAVVSVPIAKLDNLCNVVRARRRRQLSTSEKERLRRVNPFLRGKRTPIITGGNAPKIA